MDRKMNMNTNSASDRHALAAFHAQVTSQIAATKAFIAQLDTCDRAEIERLIDGHVKHARTVMAGCTGLIPDDSWKLMSQEADITPYIPCSEGREIYIRCYGHYLKETGEILNIPAKEDCHDEEPKHPILLLLELTRDLLLIRDVVKSMEQKISNTDAS